MSYLDRLQQNIVLTSPSGIEFTAKWVGNTRTRTKNLGVFKSPKIKGAILQDLDIEADVYPLTFFFDGPNNDLEANTFFVACADNGPWSVVHPVHGTKTLQLVTVSESVQPVISGNVTEITTEWLEISEGESAKSAVQLAAEAIAQNAVLEASTSDQLFRVVSQDTADKAGKFKNAVENVVTAFNNTLESITDETAEIQAQADSIKRGIDATLAGTPIDVLSAAGQIQALLGLANLVPTDLNSKLDTYGRFADEVLAFSPESDSLGNINTAGVQELALVSVLGAAGVASATTELVSRCSVIDNVESNLALFDKIVDGLDNIQELYAGNLISRSYFSQSQSFPDAARMSGLTVGYLIKSAFDLAVEKKIVLERQENPVMVAMREYGGPGDGDSNIDLFYDSNELTGQETLLLPVGKEVVVYL